MSGCIESVSSFLSTMRAKSCGTLKAIHSKDIPVSFYNPWKRSATIYLKFPFNHSRDIFITSSCGIVFPSFTCWMDSFSFANVRELVNQVYQVVALHIQQKHRLTSVAHAIFNKINIVVQLLFNFRRRHTSCFSKITDIFELLQVGPIRKWQF